MKKACENSRGATTEKARYAWYAARSYLEDLLGKEKEMNLAADRLRVVDKGTPLLLHELNCRPMLILNFLFCFQVEEHCAQFLNESRDLWVQSQVIRLVGGLHKTPHFDFDRNVGESHIVKKE